jgi:hypothetical protein
MPWRRMGECRYSSTILDLGTRWRLEVSFTPRPLYLSGNSARCPFDRRLGCYEHYAKENILASAGNRTPAFQPVALGYTDWAIPTDCTCFLRRALRNVRFYRQLSMWAQRPVGLCLHICRDTLSVCDTGFLLFVCVCLSVCTCRNVSVCLVFWAYIRRRVSK